MSASKGKHSGGKEWPGWVELQLIRRGITDKRVLRAMCDVDRGEFISPSSRHLTLADAPVPIGCGQTVSQPYVIALSLQALGLKGREKVLDVGTGSGYQAVLLSHLAAEVFTIEVHMSLYTSARLAVESRARAPVHTRHGDGSLGWPEQAPFDCIVAGCYASTPPAALLDQLASGGRMVIPVGQNRSQALMLYEKDQHGAISKKILERVVFVPLLGSQGVGPAPED